MHYLKKSLKSNPSLVLVFILCSLILEILDWLIYMCIYIYIYIFVVAYKYYLSLWIGLNFSFLNSSFREIKRKLNMYKILPAKERTVDKWYYNRKIWLHCWSLECKQSFQAMMSKDKEHAQTEYIYKAVGRGSTFHRNGRMMQKLWIEGELIIF
jgi:hypothetical protein